MNSLNYPCVICTVECRDSCIECSQCKKWVHFKCVTTNEKLIALWSKVHTRFLCKTCAFSHDRYDYHSALKRLQSKETSSKKEKLAIAKNEELLLQTYQRDNPSAICNKISSSIPGRQDEISEKILQMFQPAIASKYTARKTLGDGNCFYRAVSLGLFWNEEYHLYLRLLTSIEMMCYPDFYDVNSRSYTGSLKDNRVISSDYKTLLSMALRPGSYSETMHIYALSSALNLAIVTYCPPQTLFQSPFTRVIAGREVRLTQEPKITIMWTQLHVPVLHSDFMPNHFCLLYHRFHETNDDHVIIDTPDITASSPTHEKAVTPILQLPEKVLNTVDSNVESLLEDKFTTVDSSDAMQSPETPISSNQCNKIDHSDIEVNIHQDKSTEESMDFEDSSSQSTSEGQSNNKYEDIVECPIGTQLPGNKFLDVPSIIRILAGMQQPVHKCIPKGVKENVYFLIDNESNKTLRKTGRCSSFCDDCGIWNTSTGASPKTTYLVSGEFNFRTLHFKNGRYCVEKVLNKKKNL